MWNSQPQKSKGSCYYHIQNQDLKAMNACITPLFVYSLGSKPREWCCLLLGWIFTYQLTEYRPFSTGLSIDQPNKESAPFRLPSRFCQIKFIIILSQIFLLLDILTWRSGVHTCLHLFFFHPQTKSRENKKNLWFHNIFFTLSVYFSSVHPEKKRK